jgi:hypothetical protein
MRLARAIRSAIAKNVQTIHNINRRYATPRIKMSGPVPAILNCVESWDSHRA